MTLSGTVKIDMKFLYHYLFIIKLLCILFCRYHEMFFMIDTCQAASLYEKFYSPNILSVASSLVGEDSLSVSCNMF
jgi:glycosylphosphatidylinositol transamidase (GPIT) subunit GPI8